jgi:hypothetical protein
VVSALKDRIDEGYPLSKDNQYEKVIDETYPDRHAYFGHLDEKCL